VDKNASRISDFISEQALTAARPPRILTAFPFGVSQSKTPQDLQLKYHLFKEQKALLTNPTAQVK
jgi:hypothetical protein